MFFALPFIIFFTVSSGYSFRPRTTIRMLLKSGYDAAELRPLDIVIKKDTVDLVGKIFRYEMKPFIQKDTTAVVDLYRYLRVKSIVNVLNVKLISFLFLVWFILAILITTRKFKGCVVAMTSSFMN